MKMTCKKTLVIATVLFAALAACILPLPHCGRRVVVIDSSTASTSSVVRQPNTFVGPNGATVFAFDHGLRVLDPWWEKSAEEKRALRYGALGRITLRVVDSTGAPVADADATAHFGVTYDDFITIKTKTDADGFASFQENTIGELRLAVMKDGHYSTTLTYWFTRQGFDCARDGRWIPWDPAVEVVLKEKRNPVEMKSFWGEVQFPTNQTVWFDFAAGDLVEPHGKGKSKDLSFWAERFGDDFWCYTNRLVIAPNSGGAIAVMREDSYSGFAYAYGPPACGWVTNITLGLARTEDKILRKEMLGADEYMIVKTRHGAGDAHHAVMRVFEYRVAYRGADHARARIYYHYNPNSNDPNLEYVYGPE